MKVLLAAAEVMPFAKTGGLGEVCGSLPQVLERRGHEVAVMMPLYRSARRTTQPLAPTDHTISVWIEGRQIGGRLWRSHLPGSNVPVFLVEHDIFFDRDDPHFGHTIYQYKGADGNLHDYGDNCRRFTYFNLAVIEAMRSLNFWPDIVHANDWHTGLIPVYLRTRFADDDRFRRVRTLFTIHNQAYQGRFPKEDLPTILGLGWELFKYELLEFYDGLNFLKAGIVFADAVSTVSQRYAEEIQSWEHGWDLDEVLRKHRHKLFGIMNGIDYSIWNPAVDKLIAQAYDPTSVQAGKAACKLDLQRRLRLPQRPEVPVIGVVTRLAEQKGLDLIRGAVWDILQHDVQFVVLGTGEARYQDFFAMLARQVPHQVTAAFEFNEALAHQIIAGSDLYLMPSRFEPSGLNQLYCLKYGTVPVVRETGGLADSVRDAHPESIAGGWATGFTFRDYHPGALTWAVRRALDMYWHQPDQWRQIQLTGMAQDWSWERGAAEYERLYQKILDAA